MERGGDGLFDETPDCKAARFVAASYVCAES
jgi:hypothetical protein